MTCKDCVHHDLCFDNGTLFIRYVKGEDKENAETKCPFNNFKNKADYVEVVRCKNCKHEHTDPFCQMWCRLHRKHEGERLVEENHFCSYGEPINYESSKTERK